LTVPPVQKCRARLLEPGLIGIEGTTTTRPGREPIVNSLAREVRTLVGNGSQAWPRLVEVPDQLVYRLSEKVGDDDRSALAFVNTFGPLGLEILGPNGNGRLYQTVNGSPSRRPEGREHNATRNAVTRSRTCAAGRSAPLAGPPV
jgi:hypothetical protein